MPSGKKDIYGTKSKRLADPKDIRAEMGAARNAAIPASQRNSDREIEALMRREGTTNPSGGRAIKMPSKVAPSKAPVAKSPVTKMPLKQQVTRTTTAYRPTPMGKKK